MKKQPKTPEKPKTYWVKENKWIIIGLISIAYLWKSGQLKKVF